MTVTAVPAEIAAMISPSVPGRLRSRPALWRRSFFPQAAATSAQSAGGEPCSPRRSPRRETRSPPVSVAAWSSSVRRQCQMCSSKVSAMPYSVPSAAQAPGRIARLVVGFEFGARQRLAQEGAILPFYNGLLLLGVEAGTVSGSASGARIIICQPVASRTTPSALDFL